MKTNIYNEAMAHVIIRLMHALIEKKAHDHRSFIEASNWISLHLGYDSLGEISDALRKVYPAENKEFHDAINKAFEVHQNIYLTPASKGKTTSTSITVQSDGDGGIVVKITNQPQGATV